MQYHVAMDKFKDKIKCGNCIDILSKVKEPFADLVFADPPFNIGYEYDEYKDNVEDKTYEKWTKAWMRACCKALKSDGSFYIAIGDDYAAQVRLIGEELGLNLRNWIIWHYTFGQQTKTKFARAHTHIFYFVKDEKSYTFNADAARVISDRQKKYKDKRANPSGKMPDDVWNEYARICGTFEEREGWHPCQMPESLLARIIRVSTNENGWVLDPFNGSGTTTVVAHKLRRTYTGVEISQQYVEEARKRIQESEGLPVEGENPKDWKAHHDSELKWLYHENQVPSDALVADKFLRNLFTQKFNDRLGGTGDYFSPEDIEKRLIQLRKAGKLGPLRSEFLRRKKQSTPM